MKHQTKAIRMTRKLAPLTALALVALTPACAQGDVDLTNKSAIEKIVRDYILENPEIIEEALIALSEKKAEEEAAAARKAITDNHDLIYKSKNDFAIGPEDAPVTLVEFFDYRCGYCKRSMEWTMALPEKYDNKVRVVFKEFPILTAESEKAALAALAAGEQGKYAEMHRELMQLDNSTGFDKDDIDAAAERAGVNVDKMRADMESVKLQKVVADNKSLARKIGVDGTPAFFVGDEFVPGADQSRVNMMIENALAEIG
ncbi:MULTISPECIES: thioredoxin domain-containing protein [Henriciella]|jgi:protein-disulfide isomerase|uniref:Outer membrane protein n=1 Tax=Henriciella pelagia TaxID=1977912 RepID=A0ABQ1J823_9PROT|nr:thioredoxin domain-containing protein [Henriciella pelagia]GGB60950.1 outer membrane protein [Henriciella pelagia]